MRTNSFQRAVVRAAAVMKRTSTTRISQSSIISSSRTTIRNQQRLAMRAMATETSSLRPMLSLQSNAEPWMPRGWLEGDDEDDDGT